MHDSDEEYLRSLIYDRDAAETPEDKDEIERDIIYFVTHLCAEEYIQGRESYRDQVAKLI